MLFLMLPNKSVKCLAGRRNGSEQQKSLSVIIEWLLWKIRLMIVVMKLDAFVFLASQTSLSLSLWRYASACLLAGNGIWDFYQIIYYKRCDKPQNIRFSLLTRHDMQVVFVNVRRNSATGYFSILRLKAFHNLQRIGPDRSCLLLSLSFSGMSVTS